MFSTLVFAALFQISCALSIGQAQANENHIQARSAHLQKRMDTGAKIAIGICVPVAAFTVGLGIFIFAMYPIQLRKLRAQNPNAEIGLNELMTGRIRSKPAPPPYNEHHTSAKPSTDTLDPPSYPAQPRFDASTTPTTDAQVRHAALMS